MNLFRHVKLEKPSTIAVESTTIRTNFVDMQGFQGCMFVIVGSTLLARSGSITMRAQQSTADSTSGAVYIEGTVTTTALPTASVNYRILALDVYRPTKRYVRAVFTGSSSGRGEILAIKYGARAPGTTGLRDSTHFAGGGVVVGASS